MNTILLSDTAIFNLETREIIDLENSDITRTLTALEFAVLHYLVQNSSRVVTKDEIIDYAWRIEISPETVYQSLINIISKLRKDFPILKELIKTVRGVGYQFLNPTILGKECDIAKTKEAYLEIMDPFILIQLKMVSEKIEALYNVFYGSGV